MALESEAEMAQTWLDGFVRLIGQVLRSERKDYRKIAEVCPEFKNDLDAAKYHCKTVLEKKDLLLDANNYLAWAARAKYQAVGQDFAAVMVTQAVMSSFFLFAEDMGLPPLALQLTPDLAADFRQVDAPPVDDWQELIKQHCCVYIDIPFDLYQIDLGDRLGSLVGLFINYNEDHRDYVVFAKWAEADSISLDHQGEMIFTMGQIDTYEEKENHAYLVRRELIELIKLCCLYYLSAPKVTQDLPRISRTRYRKESEAGRSEEVVRKFSLFHVVRLHTPADRFGREEADRQAKPKEGYKIGVRYHRRGGFFWQAVGKRWQDHRLWYRRGAWAGPPGAPAVLPMHQLSQP